MSGINFFHESKRYTLLIGIHSKMSKHAISLDYDAKEMCKYILADIIYQLKFFAKKTDDPIFLSKDTLDKHYNQTYVDLLFNYYFDRWESYDLKEAFINALNVLEKLKDVNVKENVVIKNKKSDEVIFEYSKHIITAKVTNYNKLEKEYTGTNFADDLFIEAVRRPMFNIHEGIDFSNNTKKELSKLGIKSEFFAPMMDHFYENHSNPMSAFNTQATFAEQKFTKGSYLINPISNGTPRYVVKKMVSSINSAKEKLLFVFVFHKRPMIDDELLEADFFKLIGLRLKNVCILSNKKIPNEFSKISY
jgi:hypothetical protein